MRKFEIDSIWSRIKKLDQAQGNHWLWTGAKTTRGYGKVQIDNNEVYVLRVVYANEHNLTLDELEKYTIRILCGENSCVNPEHLFAVPKKLKPRA